MAVSKVSGSESPVICNLEIQAIRRFQKEHPVFFMKSDGRLAAHLLCIVILLVASTALVVTSSSLWVKILLGGINSLFIFTLINVTIHHHHTHDNAACTPAAKKILDLLYFLVLPGAGKRKSRYVRSHLYHHAHVLEPTDVDHLYGIERYLSMQKNTLTRLLYYLELTFVGAHVPGREDNRYMNAVNPADWNLKDYHRVKTVERKNSVISALWQWGAFLICARWLPWFGWGWLYPMLLVKNWAHFLGQFQHYDARLLNPGNSIWRRTKTFNVPGWFNYLLAGEIRGHYLHHLFPKMPYYNIEKACRYFEKSPQLTRLFVTPYYSV